ncbi:MAG TPA: trehalose-phosphatase [Anaerolineales bacterium]|nr:trehalose-phosphatase [Anaerolineales bacterium]
MFWHEAKSTLLAPLRDKLRLGLVTDMDGTISPLVAHPDLAAVTPRCRELLQALSDRIDLVAVVSGRSAADVRERVGLPGVVYIGNHGLERWEGGAAQVSPEAAAYRPQIETLLAPLETLLEPGMLVEDKGATLSVHYRQAAEPAAARERLRPTLARLAAAAGLALSEGHMVFEIRPPIPVDKGTAFRSLVGEHRLNAAIFIGDDITDAAALRTARALRREGACYALGVGVLSAKTPYAVLEASDILASGVSEVETLLAWLSKARSASST